MGLEDSEGGEDYEKNAQSKDIFSSENVEDNRNIHNQTPHVSSINQSIN